MSARPTQWSPKVRLERDRAIVTFYCYTPLGKERIIQHTDTYRRGRFRPLVIEKEIAEGPNAIMP